MPFGPNANNTNIKPDKDKDKKNHSTGDAQQEHLGLVHHQGTSIGAPSGTTVPVAPSQHFGSDGVFHPSPPAWVIQRQQRLRALGFNVSVDGVWGRQSQRAWQAYVTGQRASHYAAQVVAQQKAAAKRVRDLRQERVNELRLHATGAAKRARQIQRDAAHDQAVRNATMAASRHLHEVKQPRDRARQLRAQRLEDKAAARLAVLTASAERGRTALRAWGMARRHPGALKGFSVEDLALIMGDPSSPFDPTDPKDAAIVQRWLRDHGHDEVEVDGVLGEETAKALGDEFEKARHREKVRRRRALTREFYGSGILHAGDKLPYWFPSSFGRFTKVPTPGELLKALSEGGSFSAILWKGLVEQLARPDVQFIQYRIAAIRQYAERLRPTSAVEKFVGGRSYVQNLAVVIGETSTPVLGPQPIYDRAGTGNIIGYTDGASEEEVQASRAARVRMDALLSSTTFDEYQHRLAEIEKWEEFEWQQEQKRRAAEANVWWRKLLVPLAYAAKPGEWFRTELVAEGMWIQQDPVGYLRNAFDPSYRDGEGKLERYRERAEASIRAMPWYTRLPFEIVVDPLIIAGPFAKGAGAVAELSALSASRATIALGRSEKIADTVLGLNLERAGRTLEAATESRLGIPAAQAKVARILADPGEDAGIGLELISAAYRRVNRATRGLHEAVAAASNRVTVAMRHGFGAPKLPIAEGEFVPEYKFSPETKDLLDQTYTEVRSTLPSVFPSAIRALHWERASIWLNSSRRVHSAFGASLRARTFEESRNMAVHRVATRFAQDVYSEVIARAETEPFEGVVVQGGRALTANERAEAFTAKLQVEARYAAQKEYERVREAAGLYTKGTADPEIARLVAREVGFIRQRFDQVIFPALQDILEEMSETAGFKLFDDAGLWAFRDDELGDVLKALGRESFDPKKEVRVTNPMHGVPVTPDIAEELIADEIGRRVSRLEAYYVRQAVSGHPLPETWLDDEIAKVEREVRGAWAPKTVDGKTMLVDTRSHVSESGLYARHLDVSLDLPIRPDESLEGWLAKVAEIAVPRGVGPVDRELGEAVWMLSGGYGRGPGDVAFLDETARRFPIPQRDVVRQQQADAFKRAVLAREVALGSASDEAIGRALYEEGALMQALHSAKSKPLRVLSIFVKAQLALWLPAVLVMRPAWHVRNIIDNTVKTFIEGTRNPSAYFLGAREVGAVGRSAAKVGSVFDVGLYDLRAFARWNDAYLGTRVAEGLDAAMDTFWMHAPSVQRDVLERHAIPVPEKVLEQMSHRPLSIAARPRLTTVDIDAVKEMGDPDLLRRAEKLRALSAEERAAEQSLFARWKDRIFSMAGSSAEAYSRRVIYRDEYYKALRDGATPDVAFRRAIDKVEATLFDYSKITTLEDNLRVFFPFVQFWRKNLSFWTKQSVARPWVPNSLANFEQERNRLNADLPEWMQRYLPARGMSDVIALVPGLEWMKNSVVYDPLNFLSFAPLYRAFKAENPDLPADQQGWAFIGPFVDAMSDWGLGLNPFVRKPLEHAGVLNHRAWQTVFPQLAVAEAFTRRFWSDRAANFIHDFDAWLADPLFTTIDAALNGDRPSDFIVARFDEWVQSEMANQVARGETPDRDRAERRVQDFLLVQAIVGFTVGAFVRRLTPEDIYLYKLEDAVLNGDVEFQDLSPKDQELYRLWRLRKVDRVQYDRYVENLPMIQSYYRLPDYSAGQDFLREHPEVVPFVDPLFTSGRFQKAASITEARLAQDTELVFKIDALAQTLELSPETKRLAEQMLVTPELAAFWAKNDTAAEHRYKQLRGLYFHHLQRLSDTFHAIPEKDYDAKDGFLREHPELQRWWNEGQKNSDDYKVIINSLLADLRAKYFEFVDAGDWDTASAFLAKFPYLFDRLEGDEYIRDRTTGRPNQSQHARDYQRAKPYLDYYFGLPESQRDAWLNGDSEGARIVREYFAKYSADRSGGRGGMTQHARDYLAAKRWLDYYFGLPQAQRSAWLGGGSAGAAQVKAYFSKYGSFHRVGRSFSAGADLLATQNPELAQRLAFWKRYFELTPDQRPRYVSKHAEDHGVFIYGIFGARERAEREAQWLRAAARLGLTNRAAHYLYVKPLLDLFFTLGKDEKPLFLRANPEVQEYLDQFSRKSPTGDAKLDKLLDQYFALPTDSDQRSRFLKAHPEIQDYFDEHSTPAQRAMHNLLEVYFGITDSRERERFLEKHPEIQEYFDRRRRERDMAQLQATAFDDADPRLRPFMDPAALSISAEGERMRMRLAFARLDPMGLEVRRERSERPT